MRTRARISMFLLPTVAVLGAWLAMSSFLGEWSLLADGLSLHNDSITKNDLKADLFFLSSDSMKGRLAATPENQLTAEFIKSRFERLGLKPVGPNDSYYQPFNLMTATLGEDNLLEVLTGEKASIRLQPRQDYFPLELRRVRAFRRLGVCPKTPQPSCQDRGSLEHGYDWPQPRSSQERWAPVPRPGGSKRGVQSKRGHHRRI